MKYVNNTRPHALSSIEKGVDILVVGGGINGAGIFRDAALRGLSVGLIEKNDFGSGTSCRSSKLIHGGVRYLEHMDFGLVMESSVERTRLMKLLPDLVQPVPFILPVYQDSPHGLFTMDFGLWLYDALAFFRNFKLHSRLSAEKTLSVLPTLKSAGLQGSVRYYDCRVNDARLVINNVVSGCLAGGYALNYLEALEVRKEGKRATGVFVRDRLTERNFFIPCQVLVSAVGPWTNSFYAKLENTKKPLLRLTKGIHLLFPREKFKTESAVVITSKDDRRIVFVIPWEEYTLVGTTDTDFNDSPDEVRPDRTDVDYLLKLVNSFFPNLNLKSSDAISAFAGLRPLVLAEGSASSVSRKDKILLTGCGAFVIGGGKLTTYRAIAEKAVDKIIKQLASKKIKAAGCQTKRIPLVLRPDIPFDPNQTRLSGDIVEYLFARYGKQALEIIDLAGREPKLFQRLYPGLPFIFAEIPYGVRNEMLLTITDFFRLRTEIFLKAPDNGRSRLEESVNILGDLLGLGPDEKKEQIETYQSYLAKNLDCLR